ncbi:uncharacterized protein ALTATR162_LOCUS11103 [Alternaria atra]|uniref:Heterokaryon incompatibility domain-containing protein n=1 Tax=Alternaria atra TaxID=119953 RepID=A0A8J2ICH9_9PLEO|nr:uncharacterized protein ALTATR162_LOCUS11103 [Alternaria atra]CAG5184830.1 unnamed protein product [Alternaria atra]
MKEVLVVGWRRLFQGDMWYLRVQAAVFIIFYLGTCHTHTKSKSQERRKSQHDELGWTCLPSVRNFRALLNNATAKILPNFLRSQFVTKTYQYEKLSSASHTRHLTLLPAQDSNDSLKIVLGSACPEDCPPFEAVSYVWGSDQKVSQVYCRKHVIPITASLDAVLRCLRLPNAERTIWVDAICINQADIGERSQQVAMMGRIYAVGERTIIHLGTDPDGHAEAVASLLEEITQQIEHQGGSLIDSRFVPQLAMDDPLSTDQRWKSYKIMVAHDWFSRTWTVQEAALGDDPYILWGTRKIPWLRVTGVNQWLLSKARHVWFHLKPWLNDVHGRGFWMEEFPMPNFVETLARAKTLHCKNDRDRIYGFLGSPKAIVGPEKEIVLVPDYAKEYRKIYQDFAVSWLSKTQDLALLSAIEHRDDTIRSDVPSWVPRWDVTLSTNYYGLFSPGFDASKGFPVTPPDPTFGDELRVTGVVFDTITWRSDMLPNDEEWAAPGLGIEKELVDAWKYLAELQAPGSHLPYVLAFVRTLCRQAYGDDTLGFHPDEAAFALALCRQSLCFGDVDESDLEKAAIGGNAEAFTTHAGIWAGQRSIMLTKTGRYALASAITQKGDECCIFTGMPVPVVVRPAEELERYEFIGEAFVLGMMHGELHDQQAVSGIEVQRMILV